MNKLIFTFLFSTSVLFSSGFQLNEHGSRAVGFGGAFVSLANDPSTLFFNPAGLSKLSGTMIYGGGVFIMPTTSFRGISPQITEYKAKNKTYTPITFYGTTKFGDLGIGIGVNNQYGLGIDWGKEWPGKSLVTDTDLQTFFFTLGAGYSLMDNLSIGATFSLAKASFVLNRMQDFIGAANIEGETLVSHKGSDDAVAYSVGLLYELSPEIKFGLNYRSQVDFQLEGTATSDTSSSIAKTLKSFLPNEAFTADFTAPWNLHIGASYQFNPSFLISTEYQLVGWEVMDSLIADFEKVADMKIPRMYKNTEILKVGAEYDFESYQIRGGLIYDATPVPVEWIDPTLPDANRICYTAGFSTNLTENLKLDAAFMWVRASEVKTDGKNLVDFRGRKGFEGVYNSYASVGSISLQYNL